MAKQEQLEILKQGVEIWNKWREDNPDVEIDLSGANLLGANLSEANFTNADLSETNLTRAILFDVDLEWADISGANLSEANLTNAGISGANLRGATLWKADLTSTELHSADLRGADLTGAYLNATLWGADLTSAILKDTNLEECEIAYTTFVDNDLGDCLNLHTVHHDGPSLLCIDTIHKSREKYPLTSFVVVVLVTWTSNTPSSLIRV